MHVLLQPSVCMWLFHLRVARGTLYHFLSDSGICPSLCFQKDSYPSLWQSEQKLSVNFAIAYPVPQFIISHFSLLNIFFPLNLCNSSDQSWLPFSSSPWHSVSEWLWRWTALRAHTQQVPLWNQEKSSNFSSRFSSDGVKFKINRE